MMMFIYIRGDLGLYWIVLLIILLLLSVISKDAVSYKGRSITHDGALRLGHVTWRYVTYSKSMPMITLYLKGTYGFQCHPTPMISYFWPVRCGFLKKNNNIFWYLTSKQYTKTHSLISEDFALEVLFYRYDVMRTLWYFIITITMHIVQQ